MKLKFSIMIAAAAVFMFTACRKEEGTSHMKVRMKDAPGDYQQVNVEVLEVQVHHEGDGWVSLPTNQGIYDLLTLQDSVTAVLVDGSDIPSGDISQFRLILGDENTVMVDSVMHPLDTPSAQQSGLKINVHQTLEPNTVYEMLIDFDAAESIVERGNGTYSLKPVIKVVTFNPL